MICWRKIISLIVLLSCIFMLTACGLTAKKTGTKKSNSSAVTPIGKYTLKVQVNNPNFGDIEGFFYPEKVLDAGTKVTMTAVPNPGWKFEKWLSNDATINGNTTAELTFVMDKDKTVRARFISDDGSKPIYKVVLNVEEGQDIMGFVHFASFSIGYYDFVAGADVTIVALPNPGYKFVTWTVKEGSIVVPNLGLNMSQVTTVAEDCVITATFAPE